MPEAIAYWDTFWDVENVSEGIGWGPGKTYLQPTIKDQWTTVLFREKAAYGLQGITAAEVEVDAGENEIKVLVVHGGETWTYMNGTWTKQDDVSAGILAQELTQALQAIPKDWRKLGFLVGLSWTDSQAPRLYSVRVMLQVSGGQMVASLVEQLLRMLQQDLSYTTVFGLKLTKDTSQFDLQPQGQVEVIDCLRVWRTEQVEEDLLDHYDLTSKKVFLIQQLPQGTALRVQAKIRPRVYVVVGRDSYQIQPAPAVYLERLTVDSTLLPGLDYVRTGETQARKLSRVRVANVELGLMFFARRPQETIAIQESLRAWFSSHPHVTFDSIGQICDIIILEDGEIRPAETTAEVVAGGPLRVQVRNIVVPEEPADVVPLVRRMRWQLDDLE